MESGVTGGVAITGGAVSVEVSNVSLVTVGVTERTSAASSSALLSLTCIPSSSVVKYVLKYLCNVMTLHIFMLSKKEKILSELDLILMSDLVQSKIYVVFVLHTMVYFLIYQFRNTKYSNYSCFKSYITHVHCFPCTNQLLTWNDSI